MTEGIVFSMTAGIHSLSSQEKLLLRHRDSIPEKSFDKTEFNSE